MAARSLNKVLLIGNLTRDPEIRTTPNGSVVCTFGLATNNTWRTSDGIEEESTEFHNIVCWNKLAEICNQLLRKSMKVYVEGELRTRTWEDESGQKRWKTEIKISDMILLDDKGQRVSRDDQQDDSSDDQAEDNQVDDVSDVNDVEEEVLF